MAWAVAARRSLEYVSCSMIDTGNSSKWHMVKHQNTQTYHTLFCYMYHEHRALTYTYTYIHLHLCVCTARY